MPVELSKCQKYAKVLFFSEKHVKQQKNLIVDTRIHVDGKRRLFLENYSIFLSTISKKVHHFFKFKINMMKTLSANFLLLHKKTFQIDIGRLLTGFPILF